MATTRIMPLHTGKGRSVGKAIRDILDYVENPEKTDNGRLITGYQCSTRIADAEFLFSKRQYEAVTGRRQKNNVIAYHVRQSFVPGEITPEEANRIGYEFARKFTRGNHAFIVCTHIDKEHIHNHIIWNSTSSDYTRKFRNFWNSTRAVRRLSDTLCIENGLSIIENPKLPSKGKYKHYGEWQKSRGASLGNKPPSAQARLRAAIDAALSEKPKDYDAFLTLMKNAGYEYKHGKQPAFRSEGQERFTRLRALKDGYSEDDIRAVIGGDKQHVPRKKYEYKKEPPRVNMLIDIQAKLQAGKGAGYERWARVFNLKQMAQTLNYLTEHNLLEYEALTAKTAELNTRYNQLQSQIKSAEKRMAEIAVLKKHIVNYSKTRDTYVAYRKAGYSKKFLAEHEGDIILHKAAKAAFDELGVKKLPTVKGLQTEYAGLLAGKKKAYGEFVKIRDERKEALVARANIVRLLGNDAPTPQKEKEHGER